MTNAIEIRGLNLTVPQGGTVPGDLPASLARTGYVPERPHVLPALTVAETIRFHGAFYPTWDAHWVEGFPLAVMGYRTVLPPQLTSGRLVLLSDSSGPEGDGSGLRERPDLTL
jgi:hypothetical protein